jgi:GT2 family glycosyltransferase
MLGSVVLPTFNRAKAVVATLDGLRDQTLSPEDYEVIVVNDASADDTDAVVRDYIDRHTLTRWKYLRQPENRGKAAALNAGIRAAEAPIVAFIDDDIVPSWDWLASHLACHAGQERPIVSVGKVSFPPEWLEKSNLVRFYNGRYIGQNKSTANASAGVSVPLVYLAGGNCSVSRKLILELGLFDERMRRGEDSELALRLAERGVDIVYAPDAAVLHYAEAVWSYQKWFSAFKRFYIDCAPYMIERHPDAYHKHCHWFVEPVKLFREPLGHSLKKLFYRLVARPLMGRCLTQFLASRDANRFFYHPAVFLYIHVCAAIEAVNMRPRRSSNELPAPSEAPRQDSP